VKNFLKFQVAYLETITLLIFALCSFKSYSVDIVKLQRQQMSENKAAHNTEVIRRALEITEPEYGPFKLEKVNLTMSSARMLKSLGSGKLINTAIVPANELWDKHNIAIPVPVREGLLSYRLLLVNKADLATFAGINSLKELNNLTAGLHKGWLTTEIYKLNNLKVMETGHFEGLFLMLNRRRFDYIPRGVYEIYDELKARQSMLKDIVVEPTIALYIPTSSYIYVSPAEKRLAKRMKSGVIKLLANGELKKILNKYYANDISRAKLNGRKIFKIENPSNNPRDQLNYIKLLDAD